MATYSTPGAYIERQDSTQSVISPLRTDVAGFVGLASRGPVDAPVPVQSVRQFEAHFGTFTGTAFLAYAVRGFFENGGRRCWVVRVAAGGGARPAAAARITLKSLTGAPRWTVAASSPGVWGDGVAISVWTISPASTVTVFGPASPRYANVASAAGFARGDLVRLRQPGLAAPLYRVLSLVDPVARRLYFVHPDAGAGLPYDRPLFGFDPDKPLHVNSVAYAIAVRRDGWPRAFYQPLTLVPEHPRYGPRVLGLPEYPLVVPPGEPLPAPPADIAIEELAGSPLEMTEPLAVVQGRALSLGDGADGLADLTVSDFVGEEVAAGASEREKQRGYRGLRALNRVDEIAIVAAPDLVVVPESPPSYAPPDPPVPNACLDCPPPAPPAILHQPPLGFETPPQFSDEDIYRMQSTMVQLCDERRDRIALLDPTKEMASDASRGFPLLVEWRSRFDSRHAALYYPWLHVADPLGVQPTRTVPPCGHVAGLYAALDLEIGVHRAPANRVLAWVVDTSAEVDDARHGELNLIGVNVLRTQPGLGLRVLGARTISSDPAWRFVNVRRLVMMVMKAIGLATQWAAFEPNDHATRSRIVQALSEFFGALWARGALVGPEPQQAFAVRCDEVNNPPEARADGRLLADVAIAPSQPFEFIILRLGRQGNSFEILEGEAA